MTPAAFSASYSDWRVIKGRKCVQIVFEITLEKADEAYRVLGGMPIAANEVWCAVARLNEVPAPSSIVATSSIPDAGESQTERGRKFHNNQGEGKAQDAEQNPPQPGQGVRAGADKPKSPAQIAGYLCTLPSFQRFLRWKFPVQWENNRPGIDDEHVAKECIYDICTVTSRSQLTKDNMEWNALHLAFKLWTDHPELEDA